MSMHNMTDSSLADHEKIVRYLQDAAGRLHLSQITADLLIPKEDVFRHFEMIMLHRPVQIDVTTEGDLFYVFDMSDR